MSDAHLQLLSFTLAGDLFGIDIMAVQEIRALGGCRPLPDMPDYCLGVFDFRQQIVPVVDLRRRFRYPAREPDKTTVVIVVQIAHQGRGFLAGLVVDHVADVQTVTKDQLTAAPELGSGVDARFIDGMISSADGQILVILKLAGLFDAAAADALQAAGTAAISGDVAD